MKGFGEKKIEQIRSALDSAAAGPSTRARRPIEEVYPVAHALVAALRASSGADRVEVAGSFRRARETVGDLDILVTTEESARVFELFTAHPLVGEVKMRGETKETVVLRGGLQVDLRVVRPEEFGAALQYFTGSKDHNVRIRSLARERGLKVNEYGVFRGEERVAGATEEEVYACLGLAWIPPELREGRGEIEVAAGGTLPPLVSEADLRGDLHVHLAADARPDELERAVAEAGARGYRYLGVVVAGLLGDGTPWRLPEPTRTRIGELAASGIQLLQGLETGPGPVPKELASIPFDVRVLRPTTDASVSPTGPEALPPSVLIAHVGSSVASDAAVLARWVEVARRSRAAIEVGPGAERLDSTAGRQALEAGVRIHLPTGLGAGPEDPVRLVALGFARRAGAAPDAVANARPESGVSGARSGPTTSSSPGRPRSRSGTKPPP